MQVTVELQELFSYAPIIVFGLLSIGIGMIIIFWPKKRTHKKDKVPQVTVVPEKSLATIKEKYDKLLKDTETARFDEKISDRQAYQKLSEVVRDFVFEATGIRVQNYTLEEIKEAKLPKLYRLIKECYVPEFALEDNSNVYNSIKKARKVIKEWN